MRVATGNRLTNTHLANDGTNVSFPSVYKIKFAVKLVAFICATISLSWFFEGWREINQEPTIIHCAVFIGGTALTVLVLGVMAYWAYFEEKSKGTLKKRIVLFENIFVRLQERALRNSISEGERSDHG